LVEELLQEVFDGLTIGVNMRRCPECGFPSKFARFFDWRDDGTITGTDRTRTTSQITFLEASEVETLLGDLSETIGIDIDRIFISAQKSIGKALYANLPIRHMKRVPANRFLRPQWLARLLVRAIASDIASLGDGVVSLDRYRAGSSMVVRFRHPVLAPMMAGSVSGIYESVEDMPGSNVEYHLEDGDLVITLTHGVGTPGAEERLVLEEAGEGHGSLGHERCGGCGVPLEAARTWEWDVRRGAITNMKTRNREVVVAVQSLNALLRELERELGSEIPRLVYDHQKALTLRKAGGGKPGDVRAVLKNKIEAMALRGLGFPTKHHVNEDGVTVEIENAYNRDLYAAKLAAALEWSAGGTSSIDWQSREPAGARFRLSVK